MKNTRRLTNKGAALISVLVAITFTSIIAVTLLTISLNNYQMKITNERSKTNFYETEQNLNVITAKIRTSVKSMNDVNTLLTSSTGLFGATKTSAEGASIAEYTYNPAKLASIASVKSGQQNSELISTEKDDFEITSSGKIYVESTSTVDKITVSGVEVSQKSFDGAKNKIKTDLVFYAEKGKSIPSESGVGDFSLIMDNTINVSDSSGAPIALNILGNAFFQSHDSNYDPGADALVIGKNSRVNVMGDYCVVYGDIVVNDGGLLTVSGGNLTVYGNIKVNGTGALICSGKIYMDTAAGYGISGTGSTSPKTIDITDVSTLEMKKFLANDEADTSIVLGSSTGVDHFGITDLITKPANPIDPSTGAYDLSRSVTWDGATFTGYMGSGSKCIKTDEDKNTSSINFNGVSYKTRFEKDTTGTLNSELRNCLAFIWTSSSADRLLCESQGNATIISTVPIDCTQKHGISLTKIGSQTFHRLTLPYNPDGTQVDGYNSSVNQITFKTTNDSDSNFNYDSTFNIGDFFDNDADTIMNNLVTKAVGNTGGSSTPVKTTVNYVNWNKESFLN